MSGEEIIGKLGKLDLSKNPILEVKELIYDIGQIMYVLYNLYPNKTIIRARPEGSLKIISDLSYKPQKFNQAYQRASTPNKTMFYGCIASEESLTDAQYIAAHECSPLLKEKNESNELITEKITYGKWKVIEDIHLITVLHSDCFKEANNSLLCELNNYYENFKKKYPDMKQKTEIISEFFASEFSKNTIKKDYDYMISAFFTENATNCPSIDGVMYPSVKVEGKFGFNVAIKPDSVDRKMRLNMAMESTIYKHGKEIFIDNDKIAVIQESNANLNYRPIDNM